MRQLVSIFMMACAMIFVAQGQSNKFNGLDEDKFDDKGHRIFNKAEPVTLLKGVPGTIIRLSDGSLFFIKDAFGLRTEAVSCSISKDEGITWTEYPLADPEKFHIVCPVSVQTRKGTIVVGFSNSKELSPLNWNSTTHCYDPNANLPTYVIHSKDNGKTWSKPIKLHDSFTGANRGIIETKDGHIVFSTMIMRNNPGRSCVLTYVSSDGGATWKPSNVLDSPSSSGDHSGLSEAAIIQLKDGRLWMVIRTNWDYFYESYSSDNGFTWSAYSKTNIDASSAPCALIRLQSGRIVFVWNRLYHKGRNDILRVGGDRNFTDVAVCWQRNELSLMYSDDDAKTWSSPVIIAENVRPSFHPWDRNWLAYPILAELTEGVILITTAFGALQIAVKENDLHQKIQ